MSASDLHESMKDPVIRGQYLTAIRNRGKDVLIADVTEAMDLLIEMAVKVQSAERERDELKQRLANAEHQLHMAELAKFNLRSQRKAQFRKRREAEAEIARRDAAACKPYAYEFVTSGKKQVILSRTLPPIDMDEVVKLYTAAQPAVVPDIEPFIEGALKLHGLRTAADGHSQLSDGFRSGARWVVRELGAQQDSRKEMTINDTHGKTRKLYYAPVSEVCKTSQVKK